MRKFTDKDELYLLNLANNMIGKIDISHHIVRHCASPLLFFAKNNLVDTTLQSEIAKMTPSTLGRVVALAVGSPSPTVSNYRQISFCDIWGGSMNITRGIDGNWILTRCAAVVIAGAMYEILTTERVIRYVQDPARVSVTEYIPMVKMLEFVKKPRLGSTRSVPNPDIFCEDKW